MIRTLSIAILFSLLSCAHTKKSEEPASSNVQKEDSSTIVGSSHIEKAYDHKRKTYYLYGAEQLDLDNYYFDIPVVYNDAVKKGINFFLNKGRGFF